MKLITIVLFAVISALAQTAQSRMPVSLLFASPADNEGKRTKIERALSAGPAEITGNARVVDTDEHGKTIVLREGSGAFTCMPGNPKVIGDPPMCADAAAIRILTIRQAPPFRSVRTG